MRAREPGLGCVDRTTQHRVTTLTLAQLGPGRLSSRATMRAFLRHHSPIRGLSVVRAARATPLWHRYSTDSKEFLPDQTTPVTTELSFFDSVRSGPIPAFRILDRDGSLLDGAQLPEVRNPLSLPLVLGPNDHNRWIRTLPSDCSYIRILVVPPSHSHR